MTPYDPHRPHGSYGGPHSSYPPPHPAPYAPYPPPFVPPRAGISPWVWVLLGVALLGLGTCGGLVGLVAFGSQMENGGVMFDAQIPDAKKAKLRERGVIREDDRIVAFYDGSISLDLSEVCVLTTDRLVQSKDARVVTMGLADVTTIDHRVEGVIGDVIEVGARDGHRMRIEVAHLNEGVSLLNAIEDEVRKKQPDVVVHRQTPR